MAIALEETAVKYLSSASTVSVVQEAQNPLCARNTTDIKTSNTPKTMTDNPGTTDFLICRVDIITSLLFNLPRRTLYADFPHRAFQQCIPISRIGYFFLRVTS
jgi:hypothetical protein